MDPAPDAWCGIVEDDDLLERKRGVRKGFWKRYRMVQYICCSVEDGCMFEYAHAQQRGS
jgi:hypothetical protein